MIKAICSFLKPKNEVVVDHEMTFEENLCDEAVWNLDTFIVDLEGDKLKKVIGDLKEIVKHNERRLEKI